MYFAALTGTAPRKHCIGTATSATALGPFVAADAPLVCDLDEGGNIDPNLFTDPFNKNNYLIYKVDGNAIGSGGACGNSNPTPAPTPLRQLALNANNLVTPEGPSSFVLDNGEFGPSKVSCIEPNFTPNRFPPPIYIPLSPPTTDKHLSPCRRPKYRTPLDPLT